MQALLLLQLVQAPFKHAGDSGGRKRAEPGAARKPRRRKGEAVDPAELAAHEAKKAADKERRTREYEDPDNIWASFGTEDEDLSSNSLAKSKVDLLTMSIVRGQKVEKQSSFWVV